MTDDIAAGAIAADEIAEVNGTDAGPVDVAKTDTPDWTEHPLVTWVTERLAILGMSVEEAAAWCSIALVATLSRVVNLGSPPLNVEESRRALEAWTLLNDGRVAYEGGPILTNLTSIAFIVFTDGDLQARLVPALAGILLVLSPLLLRPIAGGWWAVLASLALASSTTLLSASRSVSPAIPMLLCLMVAVFMPFSRATAGHSRIDRSPSATPRFLPSISDSVVTPRLLRATMA